MLKEGRAKPSKVLVFAVLIIVSATITAEYWDQTQTLSIFQTRSDNFPQPLSSWDITLFTWLNINLYNNAVGQILLIVTLLGSLSASVMACGTLFLTGQRRRAIIASVSLILVSVLTAVLKSAFARPRPFIVVPGAVAFQLVSGWSFPSGHTSRVFSLLPSTKGMKRKIRLLGYSLAILVGFSRIYIGLHYPLDLVAGAALGIAAGRITNHYEARIVPRVEHAMVRLGMSHSTNP